MRVKVTAPITHLCPHVDERDLGTIEASWAGSEVELHAFAGYLTKWADEKVTHEALTDAVAGHLADLGAESVKVVTRWQTGGFDVEVTAWST